MTDDEREKLAHGLESALVTVRNPSTTDAEIVSKIDSLAYKLANPHQIKDPAINDRTHTCRGD